MSRPGKKKSNQKRSTAQSTAAAPGSNQPVVIASTERDISERIQLEAIRIQTDRLLRMVENLPAAAVYRENDHLMMNHAAEEITGYGRDELTTLDQWFEKLYGERAAEIRRRYERDRELGFVNQTGPIALRRKNGEQRFAEYAAYKFGDHEIWIMHDVTQRHNSEAALREREERLSAVMDNAAEAIVVIGMDGIITDFNNAAQTLFGYTADEAIGSNISQLMPSPYRETHNAYLARYRETGELSILNQKRELPGLRKNGSIFPLQLIVTEINRMGALVGIMRDLSGRKALERQIADISTQEQERIGREIHDGLGQQLTGLSMLATSVRNRLAQRHLPEAEQMDELVLQLQLAIKDARALSHGLAPVPITPEGLTDAFILLARDIQAKTGIDCHFDVYDAVDIRDRTNAMQIYRIAQEAVNNAVKHAHASRINIILDGRKDECELSVSDNGHGFQWNDAAAEGIGIRIMRYRAGIIGCNLEITSSPESGTLVRCGRSVIPSAE